MASIVLVHPLFLAGAANERAAASPYFPLGLLYLAGYIREQGHQVTIFDGTFEPDETSFDRVLREGSFDIAGLSAVITNRDTALRLATRASDAGLPVIVGGPDPTIDPAFYLGSASVDVVVHHEGEQTIAALLDLVDRDQFTTDQLHGQPGIAFRADGKVLVNHPRPPIENLDELPLPARDLIDMDRYLDHWQDNNGYTSITVATARGCPYGCEWCRDAAHGSGWRQRSPESVATEMKALKDAYSVDSIRIVDDVDGLDAEWIGEWVERSAALDAAIPFEALNRLDRDDLPMLEVRDSL